MIIVRKCTQRAIDLIKYYEQLRLELYICPAGYPTIGWGHVVNQAEKIKFANVITQEEAEEFLIKDIKQMEASVCRLINVPLEDYQYDALISFDFNLDGAALQRSTLRQKVNREEHSLVPDEFGKWIWGGGRKLPGLIKRRFAEANLYQGG